MVWIPFSLIEELRGWATKQLAVMYVRPFRRLKKTSFV